MVYYFVSFILLYIPAVSVVPSHGAVLPYLDYAGVEEVHLPAGDYLHGVLIGIEAELS